MVVRVGNFVMREFSNRNSAFPQHPRAKEDEHAAKNPGQRLVAERAHQVAAEPRRDGGREAHGEHDFPVDESVDARVVCRSGEGGDDDDGHRGGDRLFVLNAEREHEGGHHHQAATHAAKRAEQSGDEADENGRNEKFHR